MNVWRTTARRWSKYRVERLLPLALVLLFLLAWQLGVAVGLLEPLFFPAPTTIAAALLESCRTGELFTHLTATLLRVVQGVVLGCVPAALLGLVMGWSPRARVVLDPLVAAGHPMPKIAILPLLMVILGIGELSKVVAVAIAAFFPMLLSSMAAVRQISPQLFDVARCYGASRRQTLTRIVVPASLPLMLTGLRLSINVALMVTIAVELIASRTGLGTLIWLAWETMRTEELYAGIIVIAILGVTFSLVLKHAEKVLIPWQQER